MLSKQGLASVAPRRCDRDSGQRMRSTPVISTLATKRWPPGGRDERRARFLIESVAVVLSVSPTSMKPHGG